MPGGLPSIAYGSSIVGFISFAFTFFTFVRVFWQTILTLWAAPREVTQYLDNLRSELHDEREYFRVMLRRQRSRSRGGQKERVHDDLMELKILNESVKSLMRSFKKLEQPFLAESSDMQERDAERSERSVPGDYAPMILSRECFPNTHLLLLSIF